MMQQRGPMDDDSNTDPSRIPKPCPNCRAPFRKIDTYLKKAFVPPSDVIDDDDSDLPDSGIKVRHKMRNGILVDSDDDNSSGKGKEKEKIARSEFVPSTKLGSSPVSSAYTSALSLTYAHVFFGGCL